MESLEQNTACRNYFILVWEKITKIHEIEFVYSYIFVIRLLLVYVPKDLSSRIIIWINITWNVMKIYAISIS